MAKTSVLSKSSLFKCLLCFNVYENPRILPCYHSFCEECLRDYIISNVKKSSEQIACPVCQEKCDPPNRRIAIDKWASSFLLNDIITSILELEEETKESSNTICTPCKNKGEDVDAKFWCSDCKEKLCSNCHRYHKQNKVLKSHKTVTVANMRANFKLNFNQHCRFCDRDKSVDILCVHHKQICCTVCSTTVHRHCKEVLDLDKTAKTFTQGNMTVNVQNDIGKITKYLQQFRDLRETNESMFHSDIDQCIYDMDNICSAIKHQVEQFQTNFRKTAKEIREYVKSKYRKSRENLDRFSINVENSEQVFKVFDQHGNPKQQFIAYDTIISQLDSHFARLKMELDEEEDVRARLEVNKVFQELNKMETSLGKINTSFTPTCVSDFRGNIIDALQAMTTRTQVNPETSGAQIVRPSTFLPRGVTHVRSVTRREVKVGRPVVDFIAGTSLPNGHTVLADWNNRLVEFDTEHKMVGKYDLDCGPRDVTSLGHDVYVSCRTDSGDCYIYNCQLGGELTVVTKTRAPDDTWGLAVSDDGTFVIGTGRNVQILSEEFQHKIKTSGSVCVAVSSTSPAKFFHTNDHAVLCRSLKDGKHIYTYCHDNMKGPRGMCVGDIGILYVCCYDSRNVHQIFPDGKGSILLDSVHNIKVPRAILYNPHVDQVVITSDNEDTVMTVYKLK